MAKKPTKAALERAKQISRLKSAVKRAERAGYIFDTNPIPERARTSTLAKITSADIRKQSYRLTETGEKEYYSPFKIRQQAAEKARQTTKLKRLSSPEYNEYYLAQHKYASQKAKEASLKRKADVAIQKAQTVHDKYISKVIETESNFRSKGTISPAEAVIQAAQKTKQKAQNKVARQKREVDKAFTSYMQKKRAYQSAKRAEEEAQTALLPDDFSEYSDEYDYDATSGASSGSSAGSDFTDYVRNRLIDNEYVKLENWVFNKDGNPIAFYDETNEKFKPLMGTDRTDAVPFDTDNIPAEELYIINPYTGEIEGSKADEVWREHWIDAKLISGEYELTETGIVLDEHSEPIASAYLDKKKKLHFEPFVEPPDFTDIAGTNITEYANNLSPRMSSVMNEAIRTAEEEQGEDFYTNVQQKYEEFPYAFEQVLSYENYEELLNSYYYSLELILGRDLTEEERREAERAVDEDRVNRTRRKKPKSKRSKGKR